jgi:hypothetical protein
MRCARHGRAKGQGKVARSLVTPQSPACTLCESSLKRHDYSSSLCLEQTRLQLQCRSFWVIRTTRSSVSSGYIYLCG